MDKKTAVSIYKIPAIWDQDEDLKQYLGIKFEYNQIDICHNFKEHNTRITSIVDNIYLNLFCHLTEYYDIHDSNYIFVDPNINENLRFKFKNTYVWILKNKESVLNFNGADFYFLRGNYPNFYNFLTPRNSFIIFYPATSLNYKYNFNNRNLIKKKLIKKEYIFLDQEFYKRVNIALIHEDNTYKQIFKHSKLIELYKFASNKFCYLDIKRDNDIIFVADAMQPTKNHELMFDFIKYCEKKHIVIKIIYVSVKDILKSNVKNFIDPNELKYVKLVFMEYLSPEELNLVFNETRINILFSGRDSCPRTISESLASGCFNIALDTLSDGKFYYDGKLGKLIGDSNGLIKLGKSRSLSYVENINLWEQIIKILGQHFDHQSISIESKKRYNIMNLSHSIVKNG